MKNLVKITFCVMFCFGISFAEESNRGKEVYDHWCLPCHGAGMPGTKALETLYKGDIPAELTKRDDLVPEAVEFYVREGKHSMPFFRKTEIDDKDLEDLKSYLSKK